MTKRLKKLLPLTVKYVEVEGIAPAPVVKPKKQPETVTKYKGGQIYVVSKGKVSTRANDESRQKCPQCGSIGLFGGKGVCWICYKDMMSSRFD